MEEVLMKCSGGVLTLTLNRPSKRNAITPNMMKAIIAKLNSTLTDEDIKVVVLTGQGDFYSSGSDFNPVEDIDPTQGLLTFQDFVTTLIDYPKVIVAIVNGPAIGMACTTLALFDIVYASEIGYFQTPFTQLGLLAEGCSTYTFPRVFGPAKASKLLLLNERISTLEASRSGFITQVFPHEHLYKEAYARINDLAALPLQSLILTKQVVRTWDRALLHRANQEEVRLLFERFASEDFINAISNPETFKIIKNKL